MINKMKPGRIGFLILFILSITVGMTESPQEDDTDFENPALKKLEILLKRNPQTAGNIFIGKIMKNPRYQVTEAELDSMGYRLIKKNQIREAVTVFRINVGLFPDSWKAWDSFGEGFMYMNDEIQCREAYNKSLKINPENRNAQKMLRNMEEFIYGMVHETEIPLRLTPGETTGINKPFFGEKPHDHRPKLFAPGIVSTRGNLEYSCTFSPDGREMFFSARIGKNIARLFYSKWEKDGWTSPIIPDFSRGHIDFLPYIMPDGNTMFFGRIEKDENGAVISKGLYAMQRNQVKPFAWSKPYLFDDGKNWMHVSATRDLTIYTTYLQNHKTARFRSIDGWYPEAEIPEGGLHPGSHPCIAPDESYIVFDSEREGGFGKGDLWVSFRKLDETWGAGINLGKKVNTPGGEAIPHITPDGKYLFYTSNRDIYWVSAKIIEKLKPEGLK